MKGLILFIVCVGLGVDAWAEFRIWRDKKGNSVEAEFVCMSGGKAVIRDQKGKVYRFDPAGLSRADQEFLKTSIPPKIEIDFSKKQDRRNKSYSGSYSDLFMKGSVRLEKKNQEPFIKDMTVVLMMVGEDQRTRDYVMLDKVESKFSFKDSRKFELEGNQFRMYEDNYDNSYGTDYVGFLIVVRDMAGNEVAVKSSRKDFDENCMKVMAFESGQRFTKKFSKTESVRSY